MGLYRAVEAFFGLAGFLGLQRFRDHRFYKLVYRLVYIGFMKLGGV